MKKDKRIGCELLKKTPLRCGAFGFSWSILSNEHFPKKKSTLEISVMGMIETV